MISIRSALVLALAAALCAGCGGAITASLAHPARVGRVMPHALVKHDRNAEGTGFGARFLAAASSTSMRRLPPGALDDAVRLVRFDQAGVCFDLIARHTRAEDVDFRAGLSARLVSFPSGATLATPIHVASAPRGRTTIAEEDVAVQDGWTSGCDEDGCWSHATYTTETRNVAAAVYESRALFCFANDGSLSPETQAIELTLPHARFRWQFDAPASGWAQPIITMEPIYVAPTSELLRMAAPPPTSAASPRALALR